MAEKKQNKVGSFIATGRRKKSIARVRMTSGTGIITINGKNIDEYLQRDTLILIAKRALVLTNTEGKFDVDVNVIGGGIAGQAGAICHGIARALLKVSETYRKELKHAGLLTRDPRMKERKKYGLKKARKASQFSKR